MATNTKKVLLIQDVISNYRVPVYNIIARHYDFTMLYMKGKVPEEVDFPVIQHGAHHIGPLKLYDKGISKILSDYDVVLFPLSALEFSIVKAILKSKVTKRQKFIPWGIGVPASYSVRFDDPAKQKHVSLTKRLIDISDAVIFYTDYPVKKYADLGSDKRKMFVAHNTVEVLPSGETGMKDSILFVGTLYKAKSSIKMLESYKRAYQINHEVPVFRLVGGGDEYEEIKKWIANNKMEDQVVLEGPVFEEEKLKAFFSTAYACVSLGQAGLSVQKSMGYGVPFVTTENAFTGGERLDIVDGENGLLLKEEANFEKVVLEIAAEPEKYIRMGQNGKAFYREHRTIEMMAQAVIDAIEYVHKKKCNV